MSDPFMVVNSTDTLEAAKKALGDLREIAVDCEGVDLSRAGELSLIQVASESQCFLFDVLGKDKDAPIVQFLKTILEDNDVVKIIHDCRMDADALMHLLDIKLENVHDTQCWTRMAPRPLNLNDTLEHYGIAANAARDSDVYKSNYKFWTSRPLTPRMILWASGDVCKLFSLRKRQMAENSLFEPFIKKSDEYLNFNRSCVTGFVKMSSSQARSFIGPRGANIRTFESNYGALAYQCGQRGLSIGTWVVYAPNEEKLTKAIDGLKRLYSCIPCDEVVK